MPNVAIQCCNATSYCLYTCELEHNDSQKLFYKMSFPVQSVNNILVTAYCKPTASVR